ncbi:MAG TPA: PilT/PilU family type 4a pilus ATPase [Planctomycetota bacterium]|nr:PilT/PilU family type 4a pilus ATPase [Planctomycetota bacterium]
MEEAPAAPTARILYAEDDGTSVAIVRALLAREGYELAAVGSGKECLMTCRDTPPDLCLLDLTLPDASGLEVLQELRRLRPALPVLIVTGSSSVQDAVTATRLGATDYLGKPIDPARLAVSVRNALELTRQRVEIDRLRLETGEAESTYPLDSVLRQLVERGGSDLHLKIGRPPLLRISSDLVPGDFPVLDEPNMQAILRKILGKEGFLDLLENYEHDCSYLIPSLARFRVNAFKRMGVFGAALRAIPLETPTIEALGLPAVLKDICKAPQGLVLVTGPTGSGKSTTLAAMVDHLNDTQPIHIVTIEDPIEFVYTDKKSTINQRQLGSDVKSLKEALRRVLRQDPDVILMGEMRDAETMELAMHAAETGHLVFSTLHTNDAKQTLDRIVDTFPTEAAHQVRSMLAMTLQAVVSQRLVRRADGKGRVAAVEVMINAGSIRDLIAEGKTASIEKAMAQAGEYHRMQTFNQSLAKLVQAKTIAEEEALSAATNPGDLRLLLKGVTSGTGSGPAAIPRPGPAPVGTAAPSTPGQSDSGKIKISRGF